MFGEEFEGLVGAWGGDEVAGDFEGGAGEDFGVEVGTGKGVICDDLEAA